MFLCSFPVTTCINFLIKIYENSVYSQVIKFKFFIYFATFEIRLDKDISLVGTDLGVSVLLLCRETGLSGETPHIRP